MKNNIVIGVVILCLTFSASCKKTESDNLAPLLPLLSACSNYLYAFGNNTDDDDNNWVGGYLLANPFTLVSDVAVRRLSVKLSAPTNFRAGVYSDATGQPGSRITQTSLVAGAAGWNPAQVSTANLSSGNTYWLVVITENDGVRDLDSTGTCMAASDLWTTYSGGLPADLSTQVFIDIPSEIKIYAESCN